MRLGRIARAEPKRHAACFNVVTMCIRVILQRHSATALAGAVLGWPAAAMPALLVRNGA